MIINKSGTLYLCSEDILLFLTGQEEIESTVKSIKDISKDLSPGKVNFISLLNYLNIANTVGCLLLGQASAPSQLLMLFHL